MIILNYNITNSKKNCLYFLFYNFKFYKNYKIKNINNMYINTNKLVYFHLNSHFFDFSKININLFNKFYFLYFMKISILKNSIFKKKGKCINVFEKKKKNKQIFKKLFNIKIIKFSNEKTYKNLFNFCIIYLFIVNINYITFKNFKCIFPIFFNFLIFWSKNINFNAIFLKKLVCKNNQILLKEKITKFNVLYFVKFMINLNDNYNLNLVKYNLNFFSNKYLIKNLLFYENEFYPNTVNRNWKYYNNYYPVIKPNFIVYKHFLKKFKFNKNIDYILFTNKIVIKFLEKLTNKKIYFKIINNYFYKINNYYFTILINEYKNYQPSYFKKFLIIDFIEILWYSFLLKDLKMISSWISKFMESLNFKNHKKFISFFNNFINKYSSMFTDVLGIKGFFFDIRGKVGVTGSSKKRHLCFKFGSLKKSSKKNKINFNQSLVRTYSGVMGLTYIINY